jgi:hypothetical protein
MAYMIKSKAPITAKEAVNLSYKYGTIDTLYAAKNVEDEWIARGGKIPRQNI